MERRTALVLGASGGVGGEVTARLALADWQVRALHRDPDRIGRKLPVSWIKGDAMNAADVASAAEGADLIVHAVNPPGYQNWHRLVLPMIDNTIAAARVEGARILLPGTIYNFGPEVFPDISEDAPQAPHTRKGKIRVEMERRLQVAAEVGDARVLIVRAGDYFGPRAGNNWFAQALVKPGKRPRAIVTPGAPGVGHQWAYLPDVAETMVRLVDSADLADFARFHMDGQWDPDGTRMAAAIRSVLGEPELPLKSLPWTPIRLAAPVVPLFRELAEVRHLWQAPVRLKNDRLLATLGTEPRTPLTDAVRATLAGLGCLGEGTQTAGAATRQPAV